MWDANNEYSRPPPGVRELKPLCAILGKLAPSRTPPGVRELNH